MQLTPKQEKFAQCVADGMSQADAYRASYSCAASKPETVQKRASELMSDGAVSGRVDEIRASLADKALWTREDSVRTLIEVLGDAEARHNDKIAATKVLNEMHGFNAPQKVELSGDIGITGVTRKIVK